jgi:hypothetical protein
MARFARRRGVLAECVEVKIGRDVSCSIAIQAARARRAGSHANTLWTLVRRALSWMLRVVVMGLSCIARLHDRKCGTDSWGKGLSTPLWHRGGNQMAARQFVSLPD